MRFRGLDLNLLVALHALLVTKSVGAAAAQVHLSQPAMSAALRRLRDFFGDDLLVPDGKRFHLSAAGETLLPLLAEWFHDTDRIAATSAGFDPTTSQRAFRIIASDYTTMVLIAPLAARLPEIAPGVSLDLFPPHEEASRLVRDGLVDLLLGPASYAATDQPTELLFNERHVVIGCAANPALQTPLTPGAFIAAGHVVATFGPGRTPSYGDQQLEAMGIRRRVEVATGSFTSLPWFLPGTLRLALLHERLARLVCQSAPLRIAEMPFAIPPMAVLAQYPRTRRDDPGLVWLRAQIKAIAAKAA